MTKTTFLFAALALAFGLAFATPAVAQDAGAQAFVESEHVKINALLRQTESADRDTRINQVLDTMVDYDELARRTFGQPCPLTEPGCQNHWTALTDAQKGEATSLLKQLVAKNYKKNLIKTLDYDISYKGAREAEGDTKIRTEAKSKVKPRDPAIQVDYVVRGANGAYHVVDIVTEGSSLTKNYFDQFHKMLTNPDQGYPHLVGKLREKIAKP